MLLKSEAFEALAPGAVASWDWHTTSVLLISYEWDPETAGPEALAARRLAGPLVEAGARVHVLTADPRATPGAEAHGVTVAPSPRVAADRAVRTWQMLRCGIPEPECLWVRGAIDAGARALAALPSDTIVYGRAMPGASNIIGWYLARRAGLPWVAHFSDEWPPVQALASGRKWLAPYKPLLFHFWRRRILRDSGALTFTNPGQAALFLGTSEPSYRSKSFTVTHLATAPTVRGVPQQYEVFHIVHTGNLNPPGHTSQAFMRGLRLFLERTPGARGKVRFTQAGWSHGDMAEWCAHCGLEDVVRFVGRVSQFELPGLLNSASLLLGIDYARSNSTTLLSKLPDYIAAARPVLVIAAASSLMGRLFREDGAGLTASHDSPNEVADRIAEVFDAWRRRQTEGLLPRPSAVESFSRSRVLSELAGAFAVARRSHRTASAEREYSRGPASPEAVP